MRGRAVRRAPTLRLKPGVLRNGAAEGVPVVAPAAAGAGAAPNTPPPNAPRRSLALDQPEPPNYRDVATLGTETLPPAYDVAATSEAPPPPYGDMSHAPPPAYDDATAPPPPPPDAPPPPHALTAAAQRVVASGTERLEGAPCDASSFIPPVTDATPSMEAWLRGMPPSAYARSKCTLLDAPLTADLVMTEARQVLALPDVAAYVTQCQLTDDEALACLVYTADAQCYSLSCL